MTTLPASFTARVVSGFGQGKGLGTPTLNLDLAEIPDGTPEGVYAARARLEPGGDFLNATVHHGPRPVFSQPASFEVHLIDRSIERAPETLEVELVHYLREVRNFPSAEALRAQIADDIRRARAILHIA